jgi:hypothetical protein
MNIMAACIVVLVLLITGLSEVSFAAPGDPVSQTITTTGIVPEELIFNLAEAATGVDLGDIYTTSGTNHPGSGSVLSTGLWQILVGDGTIGGNGHMKRAGDTKPLSAQFQVTANGVFRPLPAYPGFFAARGGLPGSYSIVTGYRQYFTSGDYAGTYSVVILWTASATF